MLRIVENRHGSWGLRIKTLRKAQSLTQSDLAAKTGAIQETISRIERGERAPSLELGLALAAVFGLPAEVLFPLDPPTHQERAA